MKRRTLNNTEFRPRLPADPFGDTPWVLDVDALPPPSAPTTAATVLVLNTPPPADLAALLCGSPALANSLVIIATHDVPVIPPAWQIVPTVRVLKLTEPLFGNTGALGIMSVLDRAARFASTPRAAMSGRRVQVYVEDPLTREFSVRADDHLVHSKPSSPTGSAMDATLSKKGSSASMSMLSPPTAPLSVRKRRTLNFGAFPSASSSAASSVASSPASSVLSLHSNTSTSSSPLTAPSSPMLSAKPLALAQVASGTRPFDTLIHYILGPASSSAGSVSPSSLSPPSISSSSSSTKHVPEKVLLKQAILVTTLAAPYLAIPPEPPANLRNGSHRKSLSSSRSRTNSTYDASNSKKMGVSKSMPEGMGGMLKKRRETMPTVPPLPPLSPAQMSSDGTEEGGEFNPSKSTSSFQSLKKRFTLSRRSSYVPEVPPLPPTLDSHGLNDPSLPASASRKKRFSLLGRRSSALPSPDDVAAHLEAYAKLQQANLTRYTGRSHIVHVLVEPADYAAPLDTFADPKGKRPSVPVAPRRPGALVKGVEQFLVAFAYPVQGISASLSSLGAERGGSMKSVSSSSSRSPPGSPDVLKAAQGQRDESKPIPFILKGGALGAVFKLRNGADEQQLQGELGEGQEDVEQRSLAECVVFGALDEGERHGAWKAWLDVAGDVLLKDSGRVKMVQRSLQEMVGGASASSPSHPSHTPSHLRSHSTANTASRGKENQEFNEEEWGVKRKGGRTTSVSVDLRIETNVTADLGRKAVSEHGHEHGRGHVRGYSTSGYGHSDAGSPPGPSPAVHLSPPVQHTRSSSLAQTTTIIATTSTTPTTLSTSSSLSPPPTRHSPTHPIPTSPTVRPSLPTPISSSSLSPPLSVHSVHRTSPLATVGEEHHRQPVHAQDLKFHLPKARSGTALKAECLAVHAEQVDAQGETGGEGSRRTNTTGLLTPPESRTSVSSDEDILGSCEQGSETPQKAVTTSLPAEPEVEIEGGEDRKRESGLSVQSDVEVGKRPESFDFVKAYMYDPDKSGSQASSPEGSPEVAQQAKGDRRTSGERQVEVEYVRQRSLSTVAEGRRDVGAVGEERVWRSESGHGSTQGTEEYANALRRYRGELNSALVTSVGAVGHSAYSHENRSTSPNTSIGSGSVKSARSVTSGSVHEMSMVEGGVRRGCSMAGVPQKMVVQAEEPVKEERPGWERRKSWRWKSKSTEKGKEKEEQPVPPPVPRITVDFAPRVRHSSLPHSSSAPVKKYHYSKPDRATLVEQMPIVPQVQAQQHSHGLGEKEKTVKKKSTSQFREFVGRVFGGGHAQAS